MSDPTGQVPIDPSNEGLSFDGDFNAERAKSLIERLRDENKTLKGSQQPQDEKDARAIAALRRQVDELEPLAAQARALQQESMSETQRLTEAAESARRDTDIARAEAIRYKAAATHGIPAAHFDLLGSGTEEEITARAGKLSQLLAAQAAPPAPVAPGAPQTRPVEQLRSGAMPTEGQSEDDVIMQRLFGRA